MQFEWDEAKAVRNLARHGIDFELAAEVFFDLLHIAIDDDRFDHGERRMQAIGEVRGRLVLVVERNWHGQNHLSEESGSI